MLIDQNLVSAFLSTIYASVLPYNLSLSTTHEILITLESRLQPTNHSHVIQLKNELHHIPMKEITMTQYLAQIKALVDNVAAFEGHIDVEDVSFCRLFTTHSNLRFIPLSRPSV
ncbi:hypothetical protein MA16_Dca013425 [Dendrobium catenatum]|uniref:Uncharacterized protein n=1 Tax=Dendrobium catenatum TaxID=906689 RepID=A0A2I0X2U4_9ASPA|nr:hypothetical protein MA16_Dca013425 [Dendrobium catenatum]